MTNGISKALILFALGLLLSGFLQAQQSINASGGDATGIGGSVAYSVGQIVYTQQIDSTGSLAQGVQHAYKILTVGLTTNTGISLTAFPNPTAENLTLQINNFKNENLSFQLFDMQGKLLKGQQILAQQTQINTSSLPNATYFICVLNANNTKLQSFKIVKQ